jgi:hypothetical protein
MLCSLAELGWDPAVTDWVALLDAARLEAGQSLAGWQRNWREIALAVDLPQAQRLAGRELTTVGADALLTGPALSGPGWRSDGRVRATTAVRPG